MNDAHLSLVWSKAKCQSIGLLPTLLLRELGRLLLLLLPGPPPPPPAPPGPPAPPPPVLQLPLNGGLWDGNGKFEEAAAAATAAATAAALAPPPIPPIPLGSPSDPPELTMC